MISIALALLLATAAPPPPVLKQPPRADCGTDYLLPESTARLGSHTFMLLGPTHDGSVFAAHRSGTPPHNYQFILRLRLDERELAYLKEVKAASKTLPAFTTILYDSEKNQLERTFFCLFDVPRMFGKERAPIKDLAHLFPIRGSLLKDGDHEGQLKIKASAIGGDRFFSLDRDEVELVHHRYLPAYLSQERLKKALAQNRALVLEKATHAPLSPTTGTLAASGSRAYRRIDGIKGENERVCRADYYLRDQKHPATIHGFLLLGRVGERGVLAAHVYDEAPQNFQLLVELSFSDVELARYESAAKAGAPVFLLTGTAAKGRHTAAGGAFCAADIKKAIAQKTFSSTAQLYRENRFAPYERGLNLGAPVKLDSDDVKVLVNRRLPSLLRPSDVSASVPDNPDVAQPDATAGDGY